MGPFRLLIKFMLKISQGPAERDLLYQITLMAKFMLIISQDSAEKDLLYQTNS